MYTEQEDVRKLQSACCMHGPCVALLQSTEKAPTPRGASFRSRASIKDLFRVLHSGGTANNPYLLS